MNTKQKRALARITSAVSSLKKSERLGILPDVKEILNQGLDDLQFPGSKCNRCETATLDVAGECPKCDKKNPEAKNLRWDFQRSRGRILAP